MANQDGLKQVGSSAGVEEPMVQDDTPMQEDIPPQPNPEVILGVAGAAHERPPRAISPTDQMMEMMRQLMQDVRTTNDKMDEMKKDAQSMERKMDDMRGDMRTQRGEMQSMGLNL